VEELVDPALQVAEIAAQSAKEGGVALLFSAIKGHDQPVLCNLLATESRIGRALGGVSLDEVADRIARTLDTSGSEGWLERLKAAGQPAGLASVGPRQVKSAACQQIVRLGTDINLGELPLLQASPDEAGRAITATPVFSCDPDSHRPACGRFELLGLDRTRLAVCWAAHDEHARLLSEYRSRNQKMPLAVVIGGDPAFLLAASAPLPPGADVCAVAGLLREKALDVVKCRSVDLNVPAEAEIIIEGFIDPTQPPTMAGPLCGPMGQCAPPQPAPVMQVTAVTHRANPIYAIMVPGRPPHEAATVARAMQRVFRPLARLAMPELVDYDLPEFAAARHWAAVSIRKTYPGQGRAAAHAAWNLPPIKFAKVLVVVDEDIDVCDYQAVMAAVAVNVRCGRDVFIEQCPADPLDPATPSGTLGERMGIDATRKMAEEHGA
jgi:4-hydroxy-3-polyprenylbenzoate decarboxylase